MTMASNSDGNSRYSQTSIRRSMFRSRSRGCDLRFSTSSCWRKTRISASREAPTSITERSASRKRVSNANIARRSSTLAALRHKDEVLTSDNYIEVRTHLSLGKDAPNFRRFETIGNIVAIPILGGLHHQYIRV